MGSVRYTERYLDSDPPKHEELEQLAAAVRETVPDVSVGQGIAVAGTATSLAAIDGAEEVHGYRLPLATCERLVAMLAALPVEERREVSGPAPRSRTDHRGRRRDPHRVDSIDRPRGDRGKRAATSCTGPPWLPKENRPHHAGDSLTALSGRAGVRALKGPCGPDGGRRRYDAASPEPMYQMETTRVRRTACPPSGATIAQVGE